MMLTSESGIGRQARYAGCPRLAQKNGNCLRLESVGVAHDDRDWHFQTKRMHALAGAIGS